jgi:hypothetical protein
MPTRTSTSSWDGGNNRPSVSGGAGWAEHPPAQQKKEIKPMGWEEPSPPTQRKNIDTGTSYWGDPSANQNKPVSNWNSSSTPTTPNTPTPRPKPDDVPAVWDKQPPSSQPERGWGDIGQPPKVEGGAALWTSAIGPPTSAIGPPQVRYVLLCPPHTLVWWTFWFHWNCIFVGFLYQDFNVWMVLIKRPQWIDFKFADYVDLTPI